MVDTYDTFGLGPGRESTFKRPDGWENMKYDGPCFEIGDKVSSDHFPKEGTQIVNKFTVEYFALCACMGGWLEFKGQEGKQYNAINWKKV